MHSRIIQIESFPVNEDDRITEDTYIGDHWFVERIADYVAHDDYRDGTIEWLKGLCSKNSVNATSVTKSEISRFRSRRPLPPDPYCSAPTQPPPLAAAWPWQVIGKMLN